MKARPLSDYERPAVFFVNAVGDQLISLPTVRALASLFPGGIQLLLGEGMSSFLYRGVAVRESPIRVSWLDFDEKSIDVDRVAPRTEPCDLFLCLSTFASASLLELARRMGARWTVGWFDIFDQTIPFDPAKHWFDLYFRFPKQFRSELCFDDFSSPPILSSAATRAAELFVRKHGALGSRILFVHPETKPEKMWDPVALSWVLEQFLEAHPEFTVFTTSVKPYPLDLGRHSHRAVWVDEHLELAFAILSHADLFLGIDSCFLHAADLLRIPGVALFGATEASDPNQWGFRLSPDTRLVSGEKSLDKIRREDVLAALSEVALKTSVKPRSPALCGPVVEDRQA
jgi:ADP-heptose:LPS heptosyltransferase